MVDALLKSTLYFFIINLLTGRLYAYGDVYIVGIKLEIKPLNKIFVSLCVCTRTHAYSLIGLLPPLVCIKTNTQCFEGINQKPLSSHKL